MARSRVPIAALILLGCVVLACAVGAAAAADDDAATSIVMGGVGAQLTPDSKPKVWIMIGSTYMALLLIVRC